MALSAGGSVKPFRGEDVKLSIGGLAGSDGIPN